MYYAIHEIHRVLKPGGVWINVETRNSARHSEHRSKVFGPAPILTNLSAFNAIQHVMNLLGMTPDQTIQQAFFNPQLGNYEGSKPLYQCIAYCKPITITDGAQAA